VKRLLLAVCLLTVPLVGCTDGGDSDGLPADAEAGGWTVRASYPDGTERSYNVTSDPTQTDTDGDGLNDFDELNAGIDPRSVDTDRDRLLDGATLCPESGSDFEDRILEADVLEHPERAGCYLGEQRTEIGDFSYRSNPADAHSDSSPQLSDTLDDGTEIEGWQVQPVAGEAYDARSNPGLQNADTDRDGLHDGLEKQLATDPTIEDTDDDGVLDLNDAAPLGDLRVTVHIRSVNLKQDFRIDGGADLLVEVDGPQAQATQGPQAIQKGENELEWSMELDVADRGSGFTEELGGAYASGNWAKEIRLTFLHDDGGNGEPIDVRSGDQQTHVLTANYDAFADTWEGDARGGTSSGPDADATIDLTSRTR
jgi:hypothetical protein